MTTDQYRVNAANRFKKLNAESTRDLDAIVDLVARICEAPMAVVTLLDDKNQWFKAKLGLEINCTEREIAFCNYAVTQDDLMVVEDTLADDRFKNNPLVIGEPNIRFYAGATLVTKDGYGIGTLCVLDTKPRVLQQHQMDTLKVLSKQVMNLLELNWSLDSLQVHYNETQQQKLLIEQSEIKLKAMFNSSKDTHILVGKNLEVLAFNQAAAEFVKDTVGKKITLGKSILKYTDPSVIDGMTQLLNMAFDGKTINYDWQMELGNKGKRLKELRFVPIKNSAKEIIGVALNSTDVTERKLQEEQINIQTAALTRIAIIQSHELRRPVASLLGIMSIIKMEQSEQNIDYFDMIESTVNELDEKIRGIVSDSETTIHSHLSIVA